MTVTLTLAQQEAARKNFPKPRVTSPTRREDWQIGGEQDAAGKVATVFAGQAPLPDLEEVAQDEIKEVTVGKYQRHASKDETRERDNKDLETAIHFNFRSSQTAPRARWPLVVVAVLVAGAAMTLLFHFAKLSVMKETPKQSFLHTDPMMMGVAPATPCASPEGQLLVEQVAEQVKTWAQDYEWVEADEGYQELFDSFWLPAQMAKEMDCVTPYTCQQDFGGMTALQVSLVNQMFANDLRFVVGKEEPAETFLRRLESVFGTKEVDLSEYPEVEYIADRDTFVIAKPSVPEASYEAILDGVWWRSDNAELVLAATLQPRVGCSLSLARSVCSCPRAKYYLVMHYDEETGRWYFIRHMTRRIEPLIPIDERLDK